MKHIFLVISLLSISFLGFSQNDDLRTSIEKNNYLLHMIKYGYVDTVRLAPLVELGIVEILRHLDPHSQYISADDVERANEPLQGNFDGIGVSFQIVKDTIVILEAISGGPSEKLGIQAGDKIVSIDGTNATRDSARTDFVYRRLRGKKGTMVMVGILRNGRDVRDYKIVRDKIPIYSVETFFMENANTGYIQIDRFSKETASEFRDALQTLVKQGAKNIIVDLRRNSGGYMDQAIKIANEFLKEKQLIVYMEGAAQKRQESYATSGGIFKKGKLVVLIDERSASASEIVSGAIQDHDRGLIVGRRSFGKGLVQRPLPLPDKSEVRLTIARYYTPSGRCIQKPYNDGLEKYYSDMMNRYTNGEMINPDSIHLPDSLKYLTTGKRVVYGGGGIVPDIFTPVDTSRASDYYIDLQRTGTVNSFVMEYIDKERQNLLALYPTFEVFEEKFKMEGEIKEEFEIFSEKAGVVRNRIRRVGAEYFLDRMTAEMKKDSALSNCKTYTEYVNNVLWTEEKMKEFLLKLASEEDLAQNKSEETSDNFIMMQVKAHIAQTLYGRRYYFQTMRVLDEAYQRALKVVEDEKLFNTLKISY